MSKKLILLAPIVLIVSACTTSSDYSPPAGATGKQMFIGACQSCHSSGFELDAEMANVSAIANKISTGSMAMPSFPDIQGESLQLLSEYALSKNKVK